MRLNVLVCAALAVSLVTVSKDSEARRFGGGRSFSHSSSSSHSSPSSSYAPVVRLHSRNEDSGSSASSPVAVRSVSGASSAGGDGREPDLTPEQRRRRAERQAEEERLAKLADEQRKAAMEREQAEKERQAAQAAIEKEMQDRALRMEAARQNQLAMAQEKARQQLARERQCNIQPVMSDAEIALCKEVWR